MFFFSSPPPQQVGWRGFLPYRQGKVRKEGRKEEKVWPLSFLPCLQGKERIKGEGLSPAQVSVSIEKGASFGGGGGKRGRKKGSAPPGE